MSLIAENQIVKPSNPNACESASEIMKYLSELTFSSKHIVGAFDFTGYKEDDISERNFELINEKYGKCPALYSALYSISEDFSGFDCKTANREIIKHYNEGNIILVHNANEWYVPLAGILYGEKERHIVNEEFYSYKGKMLFHLDETNPNKNTEVYNRYLDLRKQWADGLEELRDAGVTVIYRPFVEMNNHNFAGTFAEEEHKVPGGYDCFKRIWRQLYDYMVNERGLNNVLFAFSSLPASYFEKYYPGADYVDIVSPTLYASDDGDIDRWLYKENYTQLLSYGKPFGLAEFGVSGNKASWKKQLDIINNKFPKITFFCIWHGANSVIADGAVGAEEFLNDSTMIYRGDMPDFRK